MFDQVPYSLVELKSNTIKIIKLPRKAAIHRNEENESRERRQNLQQLILIAENSALLRGGTFLLINFRRYPLC
jgi:hypothetical protein